MKTFLLFSATLFAGTSAVAQNTAVISQSGGQHGVSVVQSGSGNSSVISQNNNNSGNQASISQSGSGNVATVTQGSNTTGTTGQSVSVLQSGNTETHINQTDGQNNHIIINQTAGAVPGATPATDTLPKRGKRKAKKADQ